jgi:geranylgeranyl pyrophosphate synthase
VLFGLCAAGPALLQGKPKLAHALHESLCAWGAAFQAIDDVIDFVGGADKPLWRDLAERNPSHPILGAANDPLLRHELQTLWSSPPTDGEVARVAQLILATDACTQALRFATTELSRAQLLLSSHDDVQPSFLAALQPVFAWADAHLAGVEDRLSLSRSASAATT